MAITFERVIQQALNRLGAVSGVNASDAETNYDATPTTSTVDGPDFTPSMIEDALAATIGETVEAIASTPKHSERQRFVDLTNALANRDPIPEAGSGGERIIGVIGYVEDSSDHQALLPMSLDAVRSYNRFPTIYNFDAYWYAINGNRIEHTRPSVVIEVCVHTRPTVFTGDIPLEDWHEGGLVAGVTEKLAPKESLFADLRAAASEERAAHLAKIKSYVPPDLYGKAQAAPSST